MHARAPSVQVLPAVPSALNSPGLLQKPIYKELETRDTVAIPTWQLFIRCLRINEGQG